jgi:hypothetical protein
MVGLEEAALRYTALSLRVVPCVGKQPLVKDWPNKATTDPSTVERWWREGPSYNVGICPDESFCVLDVDCKKGGDESIAALEAAHGPLPETVSSMTGGGGTHHYYRRDPTRQLKYRVAKGIELLGRGRLAIEWPSVHPETRNMYQWHENCAPWERDMEPAPEWFYEPEQHTPNPPRHVIRNGAFPADKGRYHYCRAALDRQRQLVAAAGTGTRNQTLNDAALSLGHLVHHHAFTESEVRATLEAACEANGYIADDGYRAFEATFQGSWRAGLAEPHEVPDRSHPRQESRLQQAERNRGSTPDTDCRPKISECSTARWLNKELRPIEWIVNGLIPREMVTLLPAEGGAGKTMLAHAACAAVAAGRPMIGRPVTMGAAAGLFAEDPADVLHGRHERICREYGIDPAAIASQCFIASYFGHDAVLWKDGAPTQFLAELETDLKSIPELVLLVIDNAALVFAGEENDRTEVTQFMAALNGLASRLGVAILLSTHKSKSTDGSTLRAASGSTAWINAARHVLDLQPESNSQGPGLKVIKSNCTKPGEEIQLTWISGVLMPLPSPDAFERRITEGHLVQKILELVRDGDKRGVPYSSAPQASDRYLPAILARKGFKREEARSAMLTMLDNGILQQIPRTGQRRQGLRVTADRDPEER